MSLNFTHRLPRVAITVGDVAGIGPELSLRCAQLSVVKQQCVPVLYGPESAIAKISSVVGPPMPAEIVDVGSVNVDVLQAGKVNAETGRASFEAVELAIQHAIRHEVDAIVTGPIQKEAWGDAGIQYPGHTELLADRTHSREVCMMLTSDEISCVLATIHIPLADVARSLTTESIVRAIHLGSAALTTRNHRPARVTVCGLNPHSGEGGLLSYGEEENIIVPAIEIARRNGVDVNGPLSPDTAFTPATRQITDVYVCMYHDQGLIPLKTLAFDDAVNVTLGLPIVRTSVDHGTALDLAWQGKANHRSMVAAIRLATELCHSNAAHG